MNRPTHVETADGPSPLRVGLLSDTHMPMRCKEFPPSLFDALDGVDLLLHAGDVGELWVLDRLSAIAPVVAVHGNDESEDARRELPYQQVVVAGGRRILLWHSHYPDWKEEVASRQGDDLRPKLARQVQQARQAGAGIVVFGHWHIPLVYRADGVLVINPGALASGNEITRQVRQTVATLDLTAGRDPVVTHVDLAQPDQPYTPAIDWDAGFRAAWNQYSASILARDIGEAVPFLKAHLEPAEVDELRDVCVRIAHRVWGGELELLTLPMFMQALEEDGVVRDQTRERAKTLMAERRDT